MSIESHDENVGTLGRIRFVHSPAFAEIDEKGNVRCERFLPKMLVRTARELTQTELRKKSGS